MSSRKSQPDREFRTAQEVVVERLRNRILMGELQPGDRLLQAEVAAEMRTSTTPVREALWELAGAGLLDVDPHHGVTVHTPTLTELSDVYELRVLLEPLAIAAAIERLTEEDLERAADLTRAMEQDPDARTSSSWNWELWRTTARASGRPRLTEILLRLNNLAMLYVVSNLYRIPGRVQTAIAEHWAILAACRSRDQALAQSLIAAHFHASLELSRSGLLSPSEPQRARR